MSKMIGKRYLIVKKIGSGGMADVFLAMDTVLNREVALKVLRGSLSQEPVSLLRFQREARAISGLSHPNVVEVYDVGEDDGQHYIVMEMVRGTTLKELIHRRGALEIIEAVSIMKQLSNALLEAHSKQVIHRDVKPQNVLIKDDGTVKITDFGIALAEDAIQLTKHDSVMGSVHYMAPELSRGEAATVQSDIYALGIVFYELLVGDVPFRGDNPVDIAMRHMRDPLPSLHRYNPQIPNSVVNIVAKATQKNRKNRYLNIHSMIEDLDTCLLPENKNVALWQPEIIDEDSDKTKMFDRIEPVAPVKNKSKKPLIGIAALVLLVGVIGAWFLLRPKAPEELLMPNVIGKSLDEAIVEVESLGLFVSNTVTYEYSDIHDKGIVIAVRPGVDSLVEKGEQVRFTISSGLNYVVEDYKGLTLDELKSELQGQNVTIKTINEPRKDVAPGIILKQEGLMPGDKINPDMRGEITVYISSKMEMIIPSDILGKPVAQVQAELIDLGVKVNTEKLSQAGMTPSEVEKLVYNVVVRSNPMPGSYFIQDESNAITLYYYADETQTPQPGDGGDETPNQSEGEQGENE